MTAAACRRVPPEPGGVPRRGQGPVSSPQPLGRPRDTPRRYRPRVILRTAAPLALLPALLLVGCTPAEGAEPPDGEDRPRAVAWQVEGGGEYVQGENIVCDFAASIVIEDWEMMNAFDGDTPVTSMVFAQGAIAYATVWPDEIVATGVATGEGAYELELGADGFPVALRGEATITWHDADTDEWSEHPDSVELSFTQIERPEYCDS